MKLNVAVIYGSRTCEHEVSIISGLQAADNLDKSAYDVTYVYIARDGQWYTGEGLSKMEVYKNFQPENFTHVFPVGMKKPTAQDANRTVLTLMSYPTEKKGFFRSGAPKEVAQCDVALPVMHGLNGEDGTLQGMLELWNIAYTSSGVLGASVGMDKITMKQVFESAGFPVIPGEWIDRKHWVDNQSACIEKVEKNLGYPVFVKPANLGSSIGINKAKNREELIYAIDVAAEFDRRILIEHGVNELKEVNCAVLGYSDDITVSELEMPLTGKDLLDFSDKYLRNAKGGASKGMTSLSRQIPAPIPAEMSARIKEISKEAFRALDSKGVVRIDYIIDGTTNELYINEINTIPGSLAFYLFEPIGISFGKMLDKMIECAFRAKADRDRSVYSYKSTILEHVGNGAKGKLAK